MASANGGSEDALDGVGVNTLAFAFNFESLRCHSTDHERAVRSSAIRHDMRRQDTARQAQQQVPTYFLASPFGSVAGAAHAAGVCNVPDEMSDEAVEERERERGERERKRESV